MPQNGHSPSSSNSKTGSDDNMVEQSDRKKKNADAQAAFRARRANYIATLEETVTNLEAVVIQLQESCRETKSENTQLRADNERLQKEARDRERFWRALWQTKKTGMPPDPSDDSALPSYAQIHASPSSTPNRMGSVSPSHYHDPRMRYAADPTVSLAYQGGPPPEYPQRSPALGFATGSENPAIPARPSSVPAYGPYPPYVMEGSSPDDSWPQQGVHPTPPEQQPLEGSQSPTYVESPTLTSSELGYTGQYTPVGEEQKIPNGSTYMYPASRSISPASTPTSTSSASLASAPYPFTFPDGSLISDRPEFASYRRPHNGNVGPHRPELMLHGGTADIPIASSLGDALRYKLAARANTMPTATASTSFSRADNQSNDRESDDSESASYPDLTRTRPRRSTAPGTMPARTSRSPSPSPPISGTLAVIKAQAFGALRRSRGRSRRSSEGAAKAAVEALSARGLGLGIGIVNQNSNKRPRRDDNDDILS